MAIENLVAGCRWDHVQTPSVGTNRHRVQRRHINSAFVAQPRLGSTPCGGIAFKHAFGPTGVEQDDVALAKRHTLRFGGGFDLDLAKVLTGLHDLNTCLCCHVQHHAAPDQRRDRVCTQLGQAGNN